MERITEQEIYEGMNELAVELADPDFPFVPEPDWADYERYLDSLESGERFEAANKELQIC